MMNKFFAAFFAFGATMCTLTIILLLFPGTALDLLWRLNPDAHSAFSISRKSVGIAHVCRRSRVRTSCDRHVARLSLGHAPRFGNLIGQYPG